MAMYVAGGSSDRDAEACEAFNTVLTNATDGAMKKLQLVAADKNFKFSANHLVGDWFVLMGSCHIDHKLIKWGRDYGLPRGFPIIFNSKSGAYRAGGFYPKFANDSRQIDNSTEYKDVRRISFFKKWSGFLCQVMAWRREDGQLCWTATSKNSGNAANDFVQNGAEVVMPYMTEELVGFMADNQVHFCMELLHKKDQGHGARVLRSEGIITMVGNGLRSGDGGQDNEKFVDYWSLERVVELCHKFGLPCDSLVTITDDQAEASASAVESAFSRSISLNDTGADGGVAATAAGGKCARFLAELSAFRDFMDDATMEELVSKYGTVTRGTRCHADILGGTLEGLVMKLHSAAEGGGGEAVRTEKYKFARYTIRTMLIRPQLGNIYKEHAQSESKVDFRYFKDSRSAVVNYGRMLSAEAREEAAEFVQRWCVTDGGRRFWFRRFKTIAVLLYREGVAKQIEVKQQEDGHTVDEEAVARHISVCDEAEGIDLSQEYIDLSQEYDQLHVARDDTGAAAGAAGAAKASDALSAALPGVVLVMPELYERVLRPMGFVAIEDTGDDGKGKKKDDKKGGLFSGRARNWGVATKGVMLLTVGKEESAAPRKKQKVEPPAESMQEGLPIVVKLSKQLLETGPHLLLPRQYEGTDMPTPSESEGGLMMVQKELKDAKRHYGMVRSTIKRVLANGGTVEYYTPREEGGAEEGGAEEGDRGAMQVTSTEEVCEDEGASLIYKWLASAQDAGEGGMEMAEAVDGQELLPEMIVYFSGWTPALGKSSLANGIASAMHGHQTSTVFATNSEGSNRDADGAEHEGGAAAGGVSANRMDVASTFPTTLVVRAHNGDEHQRRGNKSGRFWSDFDDVRRPVTRKEAESDPTAPIADGRGVVVRLLDKALCNTPAGHVRRVLRAEPPSSVIPLWKRHRYQKLQHNCILIPDGVGGDYIEGSKCRYPPMLAALALFRMLRRHTHENDLTADHPDALKLVLLFASFAPIPDHTLGPREPGSRGGTGLFDHVIRVPILTEPTSADAVVLAPLMTAVKRCLELQEANGPKWKLPEEEEALLRKELTAETTPPLVKIFDRLQQPVEELLRGDGGVLAALERSVQSSCVVFNADDGDGPADDLDEPPLQYVSVDVRDEDAKQLVKIVEAKLGLGTVVEATGEADDGPSDLPTQLQQIKWKSKLHTTLRFCGESVDTASPEFARLLAHEDLPVRLRLLGVYSMLPDKQLITAKVTVEERVLTSIGLEGRLADERRALAREPGGPIGLHITLFNGGAVQASESNDILADTPMVPLDGELVGDITCHRYHR
jgi:hypothetical protein